MSTAMVRDDARISDFEEFGDSGFSGLGFRDLSLGIRGFGI